MRWLSSPTSRLLAVLACAGAVPLACGAGKGSPGDGNAGSGDFGGGKGTGSGKATSTAAGLGAGVGAGGGVLSSGTGMQNGPLTVVPATATVTVTLGVPTPVAFVAMEGQTNVGASWEVDLSSIASVDGAGLLTPTGNQGGLVTLTAKYAGKTATALVTVNLKKVLNPAGLSTAQQAALRAAATPDAAIQWAYPYDATVFPKGLLSPQLMWNGGGAGDAYYVHFAGKYVDFEAFTKADPPSQFALDAPSWTQLTESGPGGPVKVHVAREAAGAQTAGVVGDRTWTIANGSLRGIVYYWANSLGRVLRIKPGAAAPDDFLAAGGVTACTTCHAVSADGSTMLLGGDAPISTWDLQTNTAAYNINPGMVTNANRPWALAAISPSGDVMVENNNQTIPGPPGGSDGMWNTHTGGRVAGSGLDGVLLDMPSFGADGTKLAYVDHGTGELGYYTYDAATHAVSNPTSLVGPGNDPSIAWPSVSPDAKWIVYGRGALDTRYGPGDLYVASIAQPGVEVRLGNLDGDNYPFTAGARDQHYNYEPNFAPLNSGGFAWVVFTSRRTYGNALTGPAFVATGVGTKQIWVAAIDQNPAPGADPSHPAFYVGGQDPTTLNMRAFWTLEPCHKLGAMCGTGSECCNENCVAGVCNQPNPNQCSQDGNHCDQSSDCCHAKTGSTCINHICSEPGPQ